MLDWEGLYQAKDTGWDRGVASPALSKWLEKGVMHDVRNILIPGCGRGYEVVEFAKQGFDVTAVDLAPSAITDLNHALQAEAAQATTVCTNIFEYKAPQSFDMVYEQTCLCAIELSEREAYAQAVYDWLKPSGKLLLSMMQTGADGGPPFHCDWMDMQMLFHEDKWAWQQEAPFVIERGHASSRFELGFVLQRK